MAIPGADKRQTGEGAQPSSASSSKRSASSWLKTGAIVLGILLASAMGYFLFPKNDAEPRNKKGVYQQSDGSVWQVEDYLKKTELHDPSSFRAIHWTELRKTGGFVGLTSYRVGLIYSAKNDKNEVVMDSKMFELDEHGNVMFMLNSGPLHH